MNLLKSIFISTYMMAIMGIAGYAGWMFYQGDSVWAWGGVLLTVVPILTVISYLMIFKRVARTSEHFPLINILGIGGIALAFLEWLYFDVALLPAMMATGSWIGFLLYSFWFSTFGGREPSMKLIVGNKLPGFSAKDSSGKYLTSGQFTGKPSILIFYRGNWCPLCMAQIKELVARYKEIAELGVRVVLIAPQPHSNTVELANKFDVKFDFMSDEGNAAAKALGIENRNGTPMGMQMFGYDSDTVLPTVIITDKDGRIVWTHETDNYRVRPEPDTYLEVLRRHGMVGAG
ncbi:MAG: peroxiredoxin family protein [Gammaproteobacteria bacterium]|nr:peroxiredoxin family protein [Gammaproteobacteria bacterium]MBU1776301.1 peroxiredoxin family protein [Gammaproteobacteria bacterium]MBU1969392.1 peroxiredoxin family protein [Gammaproteobacteria bacterium]